MEIINKTFISRKHLFSAEFLNINTLCATTQPHCRNLHQAVIESQTVINDLVTNKIRLSRDIYEQKLFDSELVGWENVSNLRKHNGATLEV